MSTDCIKRYLELPYALQALQEKKLALPNPSSWDDKNDAHYIKTYQKKKKLKGVFALCLTEAIQTYHHWRIFTHGASGACIHFRTADFKEWIANTKGLIGQNVEYRTIQELRKDPPSVDELPFLKRDAYQHESEFRLLHESRTTSSGPAMFDFPEELIERVVLNPWLPQTTVRSIKQLVNSISGWKDLRVIRATITSNDEWQQFADNAK